MKLNSREDYLENEHILVFISLSPWSEDREKSQKNLRIAHEINVGNTHFRSKYALLYHW